MLNNGEGEIDRDTTYLHSINQLIKEVFIQA